MEVENNTGRALLFSLIAEKYRSDAAFEREAGLPRKTVSNWRRGLSSSYLKILPRLAEMLGVRTADLLLSDENSPETGEASLVRAWRRSASLPEEERRALGASLEELIRLYLESHGG